MRWPIVFAMVVLLGRPSRVDGAAASAARSHCRVRGLRVVGDLRAHSRRLAHLARARVAYAGGVGNRDELWRAAWRMFLAHPLLGAGAGNSELDLPKFGVYGVRTHANSWYLQSLAEGGVVLFGATLALIGASIGAFLRRPFVASLRAQPPWVLAAIAASVALARSSDP